MIKKSSLLLLGAILLLCLAAPLASVWIDFGGGTDDAACEVIESLNGGTGQAIQMENLGYEPSDAAEPWLFVLQVSLGIAIFVGAYLMLKRKAHESTTPRT